MDRVTLIVTALAAAGASRAQGDASEAVRAAHARLREAVRERLVSRPDGELALARYEADPQMAQEHLAAELARANADAADNAGLAEAAREVMKLLDLAGTRAGKYDVTVSGSQLVQIGDHNNQVNYFIQEYVDQRGSTEAAVLPGGTPTGRPLAEVTAPDEQAGSGGRERRDTIVSYLRAQAAGKVPVPQMPVTWKAVTPARTAGPGISAVTGVAELTEHLFQTPKCRLVIIGGPASGKTSLAWQLVRDIASRDDTQLMPVVFPVDTWNPFEEGFDDWLRSRLPAVPGVQGEGLELSEVLPILDGFGECGQVLTGEVLGIIGNRYHSGCPLVLLTRPVPDLLTPVQDVADAAAVELMPLPAEEIARYIEGVPWGASSPTLNRAAAAVRDEPCGVAAKVLSSPFMLDAFTRTHVSSEDFLRYAESGGASKAEELLAARFTEMQLRRSSRWGQENPPGWLSVIARRTHGGRKFYPNDLETPAVARFLVIAVAVALPAAAVSVLVHGPPFLRILAGFFLAAGYGLSLEIIGGLSRNHPTVDPQRERRIEFRKALENSGGMAQILAVLGILDVTGQYAGQWTLAVGAALGALLARPAGHWDRRLLGALGIGAVSGAVLGWAAYYGTHLGSLWEFAVPGLTAAAFVFAVGSIAGSAVRVFDGEGREGFSMALSGAALLTLPAGLLAGSVAAVANLGQFGPALPLAGKVGGLVIFIAAAAAGLILISDWLFIWAGYAHAALRGIFPITIVTFLEEFSSLGVLRRVGLGYEFKHPALCRAANRSNAARDDPI